MTDITDMTDMTDISFMTRRHVECCIYVRADCVTSPPAVSHVTADSESCIQTFGRDETGGGGDELFMMS